MPESKITPPPAEPKTPPEEPETPVAEPVAPPEKPETPAVAAPAAPAAPTKPKGKMPTWVKILLAAIAAVLVLGIAAVVGLFVLVGNATKAPVKVGDQLMSEIQSNDPTGVYAISSEAFKDATSEARLESFLDQISPRLQGKVTLVERNISTESGQEPLAVLVYSIETDDGTKYVKMILQKNGDTWQVYRFESSNSKPSASLE